MTTPPALRRARRLLPSKTSRLTRPSTNGSSGSIGFLRRPSTTPTAVSSSSTRTISDDQKVTRDRPPSGPVIQSKPLLGPTITAFAPPPAAARKRVRARPWRGRRTPSPGALGGAPEERPRGVDDRPELLARHAPYAPPTRAPRAQPPPSAEALCRLLRRRTCPRT